METKGDVTTITGMDLVGCTVRDGAAAIAFYRDVLGMTPTLVADSGRAAEFELADGTTFGVWQPPEEWSHVKPGIGVMFAVPDIHAAIAQMRERGAMLGEVIESPVCFKAWGADPEGNAFAIHQRKSNASSSHA
jgi:predicted enzyme related to lactoylglutathione lyase